MIDTMLVFAVGAAVGAGVYHLAIGWFFDRVFAKWGHRR
jgi:hypothetical protein